jgi:Phosphotransferase enzyme family
VPNPIQAEMEVWRVILLRRNASELLVFHSEFGSCLPCVELPPHTRVAEVLNARIKALWDLDVYSLYPLRATTVQPAIRYHVVEVLHHDSVAPPMARWISIHASTEACFIEPADYTAIQAWTENLTRAEANGRRSPFEKPGWFLVLRDFVQNAIRPIPLILKEDFRQFNAGSAFSLIRFETNGDAVWFKAVGEPNEREFPLTVVLSSTLPSYTPHVLATHPLWNAWITLEVPGLRLSQTKDLRVWTAAARDLAQMQIAAIEVKAVIVRCAPRDLRIGNLLAEVQPFFARLSDVMGRQTKSFPARLSLRELVQLEVDTREALLELERENIPDSLGHLDLNPENIIASSDGTVFLDWAEGSLGHPFFSFVYLLEHFCKTSGSARELQKHLIRAYAGTWESTPFVTNADRALSLAAFAAVFAHAVSTDFWRQEEMLREPRTAGYYRSLARLMKSYRDRIHSGVSNVAEVLA